MNKDNIQSVKKINNIMTGDLGSYKITTIDGMVMYAPATDDRNTEYKAVQRWEAIGNNTIAEAD